MENLFNIQQMADLTGLNAHTLRYYEKIGLIREVGRDSNGYRLYSEKDIAWIEFLVRLRDTGMPIRKMKRFSDLRYQGDATIPERRELLEEHRANVMDQMERTRAYLEQIDSKIRHYGTLEIERRNRQ